MPKKHLTPEWFRSTRIWLILHQMQKNRLSKTPPASEFIIVKYNRHGVAFEDNETIDRKKQWHFFELPFKRFHLNEKHAPEAEKIVASLTHSDTKQCVLKVKVYADGNAVIEDLEIKGQSLQKYLQNKTK